MEPELAIGACRRGLSEQAIQSGAVIAGVVERAPVMRGFEHRADVRERQVARNTGDQQVEVLLRGPGSREKCRHLHLPDSDPDPPPRQVGLDELLKLVVAAADGEQLDRQRLLA